MINEDLVVTFGSEVKALEDGRVGGYLVRFSDNDTDLQGDYFTAETDFDTPFPSKSTVYYHHGGDKTLGKKKLGGDNYKAEIRKDETGVWVEAQLDMRDRYERAIYKMAKAGKLGWSSGTAEHVMQRQRTTKGDWISRWPLGLDASLSPTPIDPQSVAVAIKSLQVEDILLDEFLEPEEAVKSLTEKIEDFNEERIGRELVNEAKGVIEILELYKQRVDSVVERNKSVKAGRMLSRDNEKMLADCGVKARDVHEAIMSLIGSLYKETPEDNTKALQVKADWLKIQYGEI